MSDAPVVRPVGAALHLLPIETRMPLKFGGETLTSVTCARARVTVEDRLGRRAIGWGETPLSVQWVWPSSLPYATRHALLTQLAAGLVAEVTALDVFGHPVELGHSFLHEHLPGVVARFQADHASPEPIPWLAALVAASPFDIALHDAYASLLGLPVYETYGRKLLRPDLSAFLEPADGSDVSFRGRRLPDAFVACPPRRLVAWHLVGGVDPLEPEDLTGNEPADAHPVLLRDWIRADGLRALKVKLRGNDPGWDRERLVRVGRIANEEGVQWLSADFNCTVTEPRYVTEILDRLLVEEPLTYARLLYVEQPFPYDLEAHPIDVRSVSARKPLFLDESAHDWSLVRLGRRLGWSGVALKTCKTQTGALLSLAWAKAHGMTLMVQDLTNPMLAQIPHVLLAAHAGTLLGVETNSMQFYPDASAPEARVHPGLYTRRDGHVDLSSISGPGFGYRLAEIERALPPPVAEAGE